MRRSFASASAETPARYYLLSFPAHANHPTVHIRQSVAEPVRLGSTERSNKRPSYKLIHPDGVRCCQLVMGFTVFGVNVEQDRKLADKVLREIPVDFPILFDDSNEVSKAYDVDAMPSTVLVDRNGEIRYMHRGYKPGYEDLYEKQIRALIRE